MFSASRVTTIGSAPGAAIVLKDPAIAPRHAVLHVEDGQVHLADNSGQGLVVNGQSVRHAVLSGLDQVELGPFRIKVELVLTSQLPAEAGVTARPAAASARPAAAPTGRPAAADPRPALATAPIAVPPEPRPAAPGAPASRPPPPPPPEPPTPGASVPTARLGAARLAADLALPVATQDAQAWDDDPGEAHDTVVASPRGLPGALSDEGVWSEGSAPELGPALAEAAAPRYEPTERLRRPPTSDLAPPPVAAPAQPPPPPPAEPPTPAALPSPEARTRPAVPSPVAASPVEAPVAEPAAPAAEAVGPPPEPEVDDEEQEELDFEAPFSLLENVLSDRFDTPVSAEHLPVAEVIAYRASRLIEMERVDRGGRFLVTDPESGADRVLFELGKDGKARVLLDDRVRGNVVVAGQSRNVVDVRTDGNLVDKKRQIHAATLGEGDFAHVKLAGSPVGYLLRFVRPPIPPANKVELKLERESRTYFGLATLAIVLLLAGIWLESLIAPTPLLAMDEEVEFAEVSVKDLELEPPDPEPEPEPPPPAPVATPEPEPEPAAEPAPTAEPAPKEAPRRRSRSRSRGGGGGGDAAPDPGQQQAAAALAALEGIGPGTANSDLSARVSNIAAMRVPSGTTKRFRIAGPTGKLPGADVVLSTTGGGGGGRDTRSAARLLRGRSVGELPGGGGGGGGGGGRVRGVVSRAPTRRIDTTGGRLSRAEIAKVVADGTAEVQRCYERELLKNPRLQGKIVFDWVIAPTGKVSSTRVASSSLDSQAVATCIGNAIKSWRFPKPVGGSVKVKYPFVFRVQGF